ncbi:MAG: formate/nitrite transporter family protein [Hyphomicrobiaceae bacterium]
MRSDQLAVDEAGGAAPMDVVPPARIAKLTLDVGVRKCNLAFVPLLSLAILAGAFIAFGAMFYTITITGSTLGFGPTRLLGGLAFSLGLVLIVIGGAELFIGNSLIVLARIEGLVTTSELMRNWGIVYVGNLIGALGIAALVYASGVLTLGNGEVANTVIAIASGKVALNPLQAFTRGILCNTLVCLAVWMCFAAHTVTGKIFAIVFPIAAFVSLGFEHSVANMYLLPVAGLLEPSATTLQGMVMNLLPVTLGNVVGGGLFVGTAYWLIYVRRSAPEVPQAPSDSARQY